MSRKNIKPVIFLAFANEQGGAGHQGYLRKLPEELRHLEGILERAEKNGLCELVIKTNATLEQVVAVFQDADYRDRVAIFHYGGHASSTGLYLESSEENAREASAEGLAEFLGQQDALELVFLNGCSTQSQARGLLDANVSAVIATSQAIDDAVATAFAGNFYSGLAGGASLRVAFREAEGAVVSDRGSDTHKLYRHIGAADGASVIADDFPWHLYVRPGAETTEDWNLPDAADDPLLGLPELPKRDLPDRPYRQLNFYTEQDAEVFFGRGYQIRDLYNLVTDATAAPVILYCGQSGVGKSSLLNAGLIPRLENRDIDPQEVRDFRRRRGEGLTLMMLERLDAGTDTSFHDAWVALESDLGRPVTVIADQVEEVFTRRNPEFPRELDDFLDGLVPMYAKTTARPQGKLILSFRKEWVQDIKRRLEERKLPHTVRYLESLDRRGIVEAIEGPASTKRLREKYQLTIEDGLADTMAVQLLSDAEAAIAPTLQIRLGRMWESAGSPPVFDTELYERLENEGFGLDQYLDQEFELLRKRHGEILDSGLALDVLEFHTTPRGTAEARTQGELEGRYAHRLEAVEAFIADCKERYLLVSITTTRTTHEGRFETEQTRLAHDTLAPLIRERFDKSPRPGQRARRILENRAVDWQAEPYGAPLDDADLGTVESGTTGMRDRDAAERRLVAASVEERFRREEEMRQRQRIRQRNQRIIRGLAAALVLFGAVAAFWGYRASQRADQVFATGMTALAGTQEDPLMASLLVASLKGYDEPANGVQVALDVAQRTVPLDVMSAHEDEVVALACSPDQRSVVTASWDQFARVWTPDDGGEPITLSGHSERVNGAVFNRNSSQVLTWGADGFAYLHMSDGTGSATPVGKHESGIESAQFNPQDGTLLVTGAKDGSVSVWDIGPSASAADARCIASPAGGEVDGQQSMCRIRVLVDQGDEIVTVQYSPDGRYLAAVTYGSGLRLWNARDYREYDAGPLHVGEILYAGFSPPDPAGDSPYLVTTSGDLEGDDNTAKIWRLAALEDGHGLADPIVLDGHSDYVNGASFSPRGDRIVTVSDDHKAIYWDVDNSARRVELSGHTERVTAARFSSDGEYVVTTADDDTALVWKVATLDKQLQVKSDTELSEALPATPLSEGSGALAVGVIVMTDAGRTTDLGVLDIAVNGREIAWTDEPSAGAGPKLEIAEWVASEAGTYTLSAADVGAYDEGRWSCRDQDDPVEVTGGGLFSGSEVTVAPGQLVTCLITSTSLPLPFMKLESHSDNVKDAVFCGNGNHVVTASSDRTVQLWDLRRNAEPLVLVRRDSVATDVEFNHDGSLIAAAFEGHKALVLELGQGDFKVLRERPLGYARTVDFKPSGELSVRNHVLIVSKREATARSYTLVEEWPVAAGEPLIKAESSNGSFESALYAPDGLSFVTASSRGFAEIRAVNTGEKLDCCESHGKGTFYAEFNPAGNRVVTAMRSRKAVISEVRDHRTTEDDPPPLLERGDHRLTVDKAVFSPDGKYVATASRDKDVRIASVDGTEKERVYQGHEGRVYSVAFNRAGTLLVSASADGEARIWKVADPDTPPIRLRADGSAIRDAEFSPDGRRVVTASSDGAVRVWRFQWDDLLEYLEHSTRVCLDAKRWVKLLGEAELKTAERRYDECRQKKRGIAALATGPPAARRLD
jgi:WD40 repeat protein